MLYLIYFLILLCFELYFFKVAKRFNIIDRPNGRSSHSDEVVLAGGGLFYIGYLIYFIVSGFEFPYFFIGLTLITLISFADDVKPQSSYLRLLLHFISIGLLLFQIGVFKSDFFIIMLSLVVCTGIINAFNFMDGINGMTGGYSIALIGTLLYINVVEFEFIDNRLLIIILISLVIFAFFNFRKNARCFAGDVGSISVAFIIVFLLGILIIKSGDFSYLTLLALYGVDTVLTIIHRIMLREDIFKPHRKHLYQIMANELKIPHVWVSAIYACIQLLVSSGLLIVNHKYLYMLFVILLFSVVYIIFMKKFYRLHINNTLNEV